MEVIKSTDQSGIACIVVNDARLDMSNAMEFKRRVQAAVQDDSRVVLDLSAVEFVDSSGLGSILSSLRDLNARGGELRLAGVQRRVRVMFELVRMHRLLQIHASTEEALAAMQVPQAA